MMQCLRHIRGFLAVARLGNFTRASAALHVSQPALTVQIRQLEGALGVSLFDRDRRRVSLAQVGRSLLGSLERVLVDLETVMSTSRDIAAGRRGVVTVAALPSVAAALLPKTIKKFAERHPGVIV